MATEKRRTRTPRVSRSATPEQVAAHNKNILERRVLHCVIDELIEGGYELRLHDGGNWATDRTRDYKVIREGLFSTKEETIYVYRPGEINHTGWLFLVHGNDGWDVIEDHAVVLEDHITKTTALINRLQEK